MTQEFKVHMTAFTGSKGNPHETRTVRIKDPRFPNLSLFQKLEMVYTNGQNDSQRQNVPSVSVGDIIEMDGELHMVDRTGFKKVSQEALKIASDYSYFGSRIMFDKELRKTIFEA